MGKSIATKVLCLSIILSFLVTPFPANTEAASFSSKSTADVLNVRSKPTTQSALIGQIKRGTTVRVTTQQGKWSKITFGKKSGWVSSTYLTYQKWTGYVNASSLHIRKTASSTGQSIALLPSGSSVTVQDQQGNWLKVYSSSKKVTGWVASSYITTKKQASSTPSAQTSKNLGTYYVTADSLNVRQSNSTSSKILTSIKKNTAITLLEKKGDWGKIKANGKTGWVSMKYLSSKKPVITLGTYYVTADTLNVRQSNSTSSKVLTSVKKNAAVTLLEKKGDWGKVKANGKTGWVSMKYLSTKKPVTTLGTYYVTADTLNVRQSNSTSSKVLTSMKKNAAVTLLEKKGDWGKVKANGKTGWVSIKYLSSKKPVITLGTYYVTADTLNVRQSNSTSSKVLTSVKKNVAVTLLEKKGDWGKVKANGKTGWVSIKYLSTKKASQIPVSSSSSYYLIKSKSSLYKAATTNSSILATLLTNNKVMKLKVSNGWTQVKLTSGTTGWVRSSQLTSTNTHSVRGKVIVVDAGHGGSDGGATGKYYGTREKNIILSTANELAKLLRGAGANVIMTRSGDTYPSLNDRTTISNRNFTDAFISIHYNNAGSSQPHGIESFYYHANYQKRLADLVNQEILRATSLYNRGVKQGNLHVVRENNKPAVLVELGFLSNKTEERLIKTTSYHKKAAKGIFNGLNLYFR